MSWLEIGYWQDEFGRTVADIVENVSGVSVRGADVSTYAAGIHFLAQWDHGDDDSILTTVEDIPTYQGDAGPYYFDDYALVVNVGLGTVALYRFAANDDDGHMMPNTCLVCGEYVDYCQGGHDSQVYNNDLRTAYEIADDAYTAATNRLESETANM